ncbi:aryldialkylphosphatase [Haliscomenobacter sp.]|uniref:phosphotriesterase family protein n=1 Tax=Haliscomenobacter sp. TaxID=2717303 RepID=UPI003364BE99
MMPFIRTILGDLPSEQMGITFSHEHVVIEENYVTLDHPDFLLNDVEKICTELQCLKTLGCSTMVDTMPVNAGRNPTKSAAISHQTGIHLIVPTGIHLEQYYPASHWRYTYTEDQLSELFIADIELGIDRFDYNGPIVERTPHRAGLIKLATGDEAITTHQEKIFRAIVNAHRATGAPILTHTNSGKHALAQAEHFAKLGANLRHVVLSHVDKNLDLDYHHALMQTGVSVEYDSAFRWKKNEENWTYTLLENLLPQYPQQITVGMDAARNTYWRSYGGTPGLDFLLTTFVEELNSRGLGTYFQAIFIDNPARIFSFEHINP